MTLNGKSCFAVFMLVVVVGSCHPLDKGRKHAELSEQIKAGTWKVLSDVPVGRFGGAAAVVNRKLHLFGGVNMNPHTPEGKLRAQAVDLHHINDPATDVWIEGASMPDARGWPGGLRHLTSRFDI